MVQVDTARLIALFVGCILYGILLTTFVSCLRSLLFSASQKFQLKSRHEIKCAAVSMKNVIDGFISYTGPGGALAFYEGAANAGAGGAAWTHWMPALEDSVQVILGDGLLIYRCYVLYDRNWRAIIAPAVAWVGLIAMSLTGSIREALLRPDQSRCHDVSHHPPFAYG
ncbi:hypothetical protein K438DRAFT_472062 [Mycena galopus ATCC 62051]|nr:hypothetical protein K438DRAFT_472062 [Mycena galopus ATCC 62051]